MPATKVGLKSFRLGMKNAAQSAFISAMPERFAAAARPRITARYEVSSRSSCACVVVCGNELPNMSRGSSCHSRCTFKRPLAASATSQVISASEICRSVVSMSQTGCVRSFQRA